MNKISDFNVGDSAIVEHLITQQDIEKFADLTGDDNRLHLDKEFARQTSFKGTVAHGMLSASFISTVIGTKLPGDGALWFSQAIDFLLPVRVGDHICVKAEIVNILEGQNIIELGVKITNQHKQIVTQGVCKVKLIEVGKEEVVSQEEPLPYSKTALVIGATGGIGRAVCLGLARKGFNVAVHYHTNETGARELKAEIDALGGKSCITQGDVKEAAQIKTIFETVRRYLDPVTVLVNCSTGPIAPVKFEDLSWGDIQEHIDINVRGAFYLMKEAIPFMAAQKYGKIVHVTSLAVDMPNPEWLGYITAKAALEGFSRALAVELAPQGIRINLVSPGMVDTSLISNVPEKVKLLTGAMTPLRRIAFPKDVASAVCFLVTEDGDFLAGETIRVNGGKFML